MVIDGFCYDCKHHQEYTHICELTGEKVKFLDHCCYFRPR